MIYSTHGWLHLSLGKADNWLRWSIFGFVITTVFFMAGLPYGANGVALGRVIAIHLLALPGVWYAGRPVQLSIGSLVQAIWKYYVSSLLAGLVTWAMLHNWIPSGESWEVHLLRVFLGSTFCMSIYLVFTVALHQGLKPIVDFVSIVRESVSGLRLGSRA
jgi:PST family polysaccharide transporter